MLKVSRQKGFTIVELLIVIVIIGILAAIVIVAYNGIQNNATQAAIKSDLTSTSKKLDAYKVTSATNSYPATTTELDAAELRLSQGNYAINRNNIYYCRSTDGQHYSLGVIMKNGAVEYYLKDGVITQLGAGNINSVNNCTNIGYPAPAGSYAGFDWYGTGWQSWV